VTGPSCRWRRNAGSRGRSLPAHEQDQGQRPNTHSRALAQPSPSDRRLGTRFALRFSPSHSPSPEKRQDFPRNPMNCEDLPAHWRDRMDRAAGRLATHVRALCRRARVAYHAAPPRTDAPEREKLHERSPSLPADHPRSGPAGLRRRRLRPRAANRKPLTAHRHGTGWEAHDHGPKWTMPGDPHAAPAPGLMERMREHAGALRHRDRDGSHQRSGPLAPSAPAQGDRGAYTCDALIIATGRAHVTRLESEQAFRGRGVRPGATCDGFFFRGQRVAVIGGAHGRREALYLSNIASHVTLVHRRDKLRSERSCRTAVRA